jgi:uncharacterized membrane protein YphA (DoxX/SURF4 family)
MPSFDRRLNTAWWALRIGLGIAPIVAGLDKFFNILVDWSMYLSPLTTRVVHLTPSTFMHIVGVIEIIAGIVVLSRWTRLGAYVVMAWLIGISINLLTTGMFYDLAVRDLELSIAAFTLAQLTAVREGAPQSQSQRSSQVAVNS